MLGMSPVYCITLKWLSDACILAGVALGLALMMYGREEGAETLIEQMTRDQDPIIRYGGMYTIGMAYRWVRGWELCWSVLVASRSTVDWLHVTC
jgi:hypothetical protein